MADKVNNADKSVFAPQVISKMAVDVIRDRRDKPTTGTRTGIDAVDKILNPQRPGELRVILGFTSNYKTGLMNNIARYNARLIKDEGQAGKKAVITFIWEQSVEEQGIVDLSQLSVLDATKLIRGELDDNDWRKLQEAAVQRGKIPWWLVGHSSESKERRPRLTMEDVYDAITHIVDVQGIEPVLIVLDYLQRIKRVGHNGRIREQFIDIVDQSKDLALAFHVPVMLGSQAGRSVKSRQWRLPQTDDGQETSNLEQSADSLISLWMPKNDYAPGTMIEYGDQSYTVNDNLLIFGVMKQKFGPAPRILPLYVKAEVNEIYERYNAAR